MCLICPIFVCFPSLTFFNRKGGEKEGIAKGLRTVLTERFGEEAVKGKIY